LTVRLTTKKGKKNKNTCIHDSKKNKEKRMKNKNKKQKLFHIHDCVFSKSLVFQKGKWGRKLKLLASRDSV
jgi:hypothetical protein